jgi:hypothetical protein
MNWFGRYCDKHARHVTLNFAISVVIFSSIFAPVEAFLAFSEIRSGYALGAVINIVLAVLSLSWILIGRGIIHAHYRRAGAAFQAVPSPVATSDLKASS